MNAPVALAPYQGLTFRHADREANVHSVAAGIVYYGVYVESAEPPIALFQVSLDGWNELAQQAIDAGAVVFSLIRGRAA